MKWRHRHFTYCPPSWRIQTNCWPSDDNLQSALFQVRESILSILQPIMKHGNNLCRTTREGRTQLVAKNATGPNSFSNRTCVIRVALAANRKHQSKSVWCKRAPVANQNIAVLWMGTWPYPQKSGRHCKIPLGTLHVLSGTSPTPSSGSPSLKKQWFLDGRDARGV